MSQHMRITCLWITFCIAAGLATLSMGCSNAERPCQWERDSPSGDIGGFDANANLPPTPTTLYALARIYRTQGRDGPCESLLIKIIAEHRRFMPAYCDLAELRLRQRRIDDAYKTLEAGLRISPGDPVLLNDLGMCHLLKSDYDKALDAFTSAAAIVPHDPRHRANMAVALGLLGRDEEALALYEQILAPEEVACNLTTLRRARQHITPQIAASDFSTPAPESQPAQLDSLVSP